VIEALDERRDLARVKRRILPTADWRSVIPSSEPTSQPRQRDFDFRNVLPAEWEHRHHHAWVSAYRMVGVPIAAVSPPFAVALSEVCLVMGWFLLPRLGIEHEYEPSHDGELKISVRPGGGEPRVPAPSALFFCPADQNDLVEITHAQERIHDAVGMLSAVESLLLVFEHVENYWWSLSEGELQSAPMFLVDPLWYFTPSLGEDARQRWATVADAITNHPDRDLIDLSLRWFDEAKRTRGVDAFTAVRSPASCSRGRC
jgi:hypothetical protein